MKINTSDVITRIENKADFQTIQEVNDAAFEQDIEGNVIDKIRKVDESALSLVALYNDKIVGHIFFSSATIDGHSEIKKGMGLAPMAVLPGYQKLGIGKKLIKEGIKRIKKSLVPYIIVLGHPEYYSKFEFEAASKHGLVCQWNDVPDEAFMVLILDHSAMKNVHGVARYRDEWNEAM